MNFKGTLTTLALAGSLTAGLAADPTPPTAPPTMPPAASTNSPEAILKNGSHAFGVWNANQWKSTYFFASDFDLGEVERGASETLQGKRPDGNTNVMTLKEAQEWLKEFVDLAVTNKMKKEAVFLAENKKKEGVITLPDGLQYKVLQEGTGATPTMSNSVRVNYSGKLVNGTEFDSTYNDPRARGPATLDMRGVVKGWAEALMLMKEGGKLQAFIPSDLGYGPKGRRGIPPNSALIFEIDLLSVTNQPAPVALPAPAVSSPPPGARVIGGPAGTLPPAGARAVSPILQVNPDGTSRILPPDATAPAPPAPPVPAKP